MRGRRGVAIMRNILAPRTEGRAPPECDLELMMMRLIDKSGLPQPVQQYPVSLPSGEIRVDIAYPEAMLAIELDGYIWHMDRAAFERDRQRDNELRASGWTVYRFTWAMLRFDSVRIVDLVRRHLDQFRVTGHAIALIANVVLTRRKGEGKRGAGAGVPAPAR